MWPAADCECKEALCSVLQVTDRSVRAVAENCPELQFVGFMGCPVTSQGVIHLTAVSVTRISSSPLYKWSSEPLFFFPLNPLRQLMICAPDVMKVSLT